MKRRSSRGSLIKAPDVEPLGSWVSGTFVECRHVLSFLRHCESPPRRSLRRRSSIANGAAKVSLLLIRTHCAPDIVHAPENIWPFLCASVSGNGHQDTVPPARSFSRLSLVLVLRSGRVAYAANFYTTQAPKTKECFMLGICFCWLEARINPSARNRHDSETFPFVVGRCVWKH